MIWYFVAIATIFGASANDFGFREVLRGNSEMAKHLSCLGAIKSIGGPNFGDSYLDSGRSTESSIVIFKAPNNEFCLISFNTNHCFTPPNKSDGRGAQHVWVEGADTMVSFEAGKLAAVSGRDAINVTRNLTRNPILNEARNRGDQQTADRERKVDEEEATIKFLVDSVHFSGTQKTLERFAKASDLKLESKLVERGLTSSSYVFTLTGKRKRLRQWITTTCAGGQADACTVMHRDNIVRAEDIITAPSRGLPATKTAAARTGARVSFISAPSVSALGGTPCRCIS
jgi:hypothetical protein